MVKLMARHRELTNRKAQADQRAAQAQHESTFLSGAIDDLNYMMNTWVSHQAWIEPTMGKTGNEGRAGHSVDISPVYPREIVGEWGDFVNPLEPIHSGTAD